MKIFKITIVMLLIGIGITACKGTKSEHHIELSSREIFDEKDDIAKVHADFLASEYIEVEYSGSQHFDLSIEVWENGEKVDTYTKLMDIDGSKLEGISIALNPSVDEENNTIVGVYYDEGVTSSKFKLPKPSIEYNGRVESTLTEETEFLDTEEIALWGFHYFDTEFRAFSDSYDAAKEMEWSLVLVLKPTE